MSSQPFPPLQTSPTWWLMIGKLHTKHIAVIVLLNGRTSSWWKVVKCSFHRILLRLHFQNHSKSFKSPQLKMCSPFVRRMKAHAANDWTILQIKKRLLLWEFMNSCNATLCQAFNVTKIIKLCSKSVRSFQFTRKPLNFHLLSRATWRKWKKVWCEGDVIRQRASSCDSQIAMHLSSCI